jgi:hypothetical protein
VYYNFRKITYTFTLVMTDSPTQKNYLPIIIGTILTVAVIIGGFFLIQRVLGGGASNFQQASNYIRPHNATIGKTNSNVKLVYLYDYMCPACQSNADNMATLKSKFSDRVQFVYKPYIVQSGSGDRMAWAANAANRQGKFVEFDSKLIKLTPTKQTGLPLSELESLAKEVGMDVTKFTKDYNSKEVEDQTKTDQKDISGTILPVSKFSEVAGATKAGSTPTLVLLKDDKLTSSWWSGVLPVETVEQRINEILEQK